MEVVFPVVFPFLGNLILLEEAGNTETLVLGSW